MSIQHPFRTLAIAFVFVLFLVVGRHLLESPPRPDRLDTPPLPPTVHVVREPAERVDDVPTIVEPNDNWLETPRASNEEFLREPHAEEAHLLPPVQMAPDGRLRR